MMVVLVEQKDVYALLERVDALEKRAAERFEAQTPEMVHAARETARMFRFAIVEWLQDQGAKVTR